MPAVATDLQSSALRADARHERHLPALPAADHAESRRSQHHLVLRLRGGRNGETVLLHQICHSEIHAALSETELARRYSTIEALRAHPRIARFLVWVWNKPPAFHSRTSGKGRRRR